MKKRVVFVLSISLLLFSLLAGCDEDWDEEALDDVGSSTVVSSESAGELAVASNVENNVENNAETNVEAPKGRSGLVIEEPKSTLDSNPKRAVRRSTTPIHQVVETKLDGTTVSSDFYMYRAT